MNPSTTKLHIDRDAMLARLSAGPVSVNSSDKACREKISVTISN